MSDIESELAGRVADARARRAALRIRGGGTKDFYGDALRGELLETCRHDGVVSYEPSELVVTVRAGTRLEALERSLTEEGQMLPFEPPHFGGDATVGGCVAAGLSGPRRASAGAVRDYVLGVRMLDGGGQVHSFGGRVIKNVAGYDVSRLLAGSLGVLGLILEVSLKLLPLPRAEETLQLELSEAAAIETMNRWAGRPLPVSATCWHDGVMSVRLSGAEASVRAGAARIGGARISPDRATGFWHDVREHRAPYFRHAGSLWRLALPSTTPPVGLGDSLLEWNGGQRWLVSTDATRVREVAVEAGGHATLFRARERSAAAFTPLSPSTQRLQRALKQVFDPEGVFNPGRMYADI